VPSGPPPPEPDPGGRRIPDPGFAGDAGGADAALAAALADHAAGRVGAADVLVALTTARLLVPVVALLEEEAVDGGTGLRREKTSSMATMTVEGADGRRALPAFTSTAALAAWRREARPVPVTAQQAAAVARQQGADAVVLDLAGPVTYVLEGVALDRTAAGYRVVVGPDGPAWAVPLTPERPEAAG
jgi:SseB protein N-terminal domain